mmetsp:Transcript_71592/g.159203  ORF Transcript_71592/g.159203 Transcript_71592/m.159203 type:complete len:331 (-) Transcript_71592:256-1248(-)
MAVFSTRDLLRPSWCLLMIGISCCRMVSTNGFISGPTLTAISPSAHEALLQTDTNSGSSCCVSTVKCSLRSGLSTPIAALARSPTRAYADCRTSGCSSFMQASNSWAMGEGARSCSIAGPMPSVMPEMRSNAQTIISLSGGSPPSACACRSSTKVDSMSRRHRVNTGCANCWKPLPRAWAIDVKHSSSGNRPLSVSVSMFQRAMRGGINICTYGSRLSSLPTESASVPTASYRMSRFFAWYFSQANMRLRRMGSRYGTRLREASSSRVANAEHAASCTFLLWSSTLFSNSCISGLRYTSCSCCWATTHLEYRDSVQQVIERMSGLGSLRV